jgi:DNA-binding NarL/FixJ family response regulator
VSPSPLRLLLIDDHRLFVHGLRLILERAEGLVVAGEASNRPSARVLAERLQPDLIVADIHLADGDGITLVEELRARQPSVKALFVSSDADLALVRRALHAGGSGYLLKDNAPQDLLRAIAVVARGGVYLCAEVAGVLQSTGADASATPERGARARLSERETEVLKLIAEGVCRKDIANHLEVSVKSVETYRKRLLHKLGYASTAHLVRHAVREHLVAP